MPVPGRNTAVLVDQYDMSTYLSEFEFQREAEDIDVSHFGSKVRSYLSGPQETTVTLTGWYDGGKDQVDDIFHKRFGAPGDTLVTLCPDTATFGKACYLTPTTQVAYNLSTAVEDAVEIEAEFRANGFVDRGHILHPVNTARTATGDGTALDNGTLETTTAFGGTAHLHCFAASGTTPTLDLIIEDSADDTTYATIITFDQLTGVGSQRKSTATTTTTVRRYVRASWTIAGTTPSFTFAVSFARGLGF